jgi:peptide/nickel transport system permease protein
VITEAGGRPFGIGSAVRSSTTNPWLRFVLRRILALVLVLGALVMATFLMVRLSRTDPAITLLGTQATPSDVARVHHQLGLDEPVLVQFQNYVIGLAHGDMGTSFFNGQKVSNVIAQRSGQSIQLAGAGLFLVLLGIPAGLLAAALTTEGRHRRLEAVFIGGTSLLVAIPEFLAATMLAFVFAVKLEWLPVAGASSFQALILPAIAVAVVPFAALSRIVRVETLNVLAQDYIRTARSKRLPQLTIYLRHVLPNVLSTIVVIATLELARAIVLEATLSFLGLGIQPPTPSWGNMLKDAQTDMATAPWTAIFPGLAIFLTVVSINFVGDGLRDALDPRHVLRNVRR